MTSTVLPGAVQAMIDTETITADNALTLRRMLYSGGAIDAAEAECLFALNAAVHTADPAWDTLFVEALTDYCVHQVDPQGHVTEDKAHWLINRIAHDGRIEEARELELIVSILQKSTSSPASLATFVLKAVRDCVLSGAGPLRGRETDAQPRVCADDVSLMRRAVFAFGAGGNVFVTHEEAELLCDINDATAQANNDPAWPDFFAKAIGNHLMMAATYEPASRDAATQREKWLDDHAVNVGGFFGRMAKGLKSALTGSDDQLAIREKMREAAFAAAAPVIEPEALWLADRLNRDGALSPAEETLLRFLKSDGAPIHKSLQPLLARVV
jgi:hypothetical protein